MQTFLPLPSFEKSLNVLDSQRLGKQRVEAFQILRVLVGVTHGWENHPCVNMWRNFEYQLSVYYNQTVSEWVSRGFNNNMSFVTFSENSIVVPPTITESLNGFENVFYVYKNTDYPNWFGKDEFHKIHRNNLYHKSPRYYSQFMWEDLYSSPVDYLWS